MTSDRQVKIAANIGQLVATFIAAESNRTSLITVTNTTISPDLKKATVFFTVLPTDKEKEVLFFLKRNGKEIRSYLSDRISFKVLPFVEFEVDKGEKSRQHIDKLLREDS